MLRLIQPMFCRHVAAINILFDTTSGRITALIDYDVACILRSFDDAGG
jgi:hypothetical protein